MVQLIDIIKLRLNSKIKKFSYSFICGKGYSPPSGKNSFLSTVCGGFLSPIKKVPHAFRHMTLSGAPTAIRTRGLSLRRTRVVLFVHIVSFDFLSFHLDLSRNSASFPKRQTGLIVGFVWLFRTPLLAEFQLFPIPRKPAIPSLPQGKEMQSRKERLALLCPAAFFCT